MLLFIADLLIGCLHLFEFLFGFCFIWIVYICIRVIFPAERAVSFFNFLVARIMRNTQHFIRICHITNTPACTAACNNV